jgi:hypothetical protein
MNLDLEDHRNLNIRNCLGRGGEGAQEGIRTEEHGEMCIVVDELTVLLLRGLPRCA